MVKWPVCKKYFTQSALSKNAWKSNGAPWWIIGKHSVVYQINLPRFEPAHCRDEEISDRRHQCECPTYYRRFLMPLPSIQCAIQADLCPTDSTTMVHPVCSISTRQSHSAIVSHSIDLRKSLDHLRLLAGILCRHKLQAPIWRSSDAPGHQIYWRQSKRNHSTHMLSRCERFAPQMIWSAECIH